MIPKTIHYCWFGRNPFPPLALQCIASWKKFCPDYEIIEWNENNFDIKQNTYVREAYEAKKWAFVSDYARLWVLVNHGGFYLDADCELVKPIDTFLNLEAVSGFESDSRVSAGIMGCRKGHPLFVEFLKRYDNRRFIKWNGSFDTTTNTKDITKACLAHGLVLNGEKQTISGFTLFPRDYFCPKHACTGEMEAFTENTHAIHHFSGSWGTPKTKIEQMLSRLFGKPERFIRQWVIKPIKKWLKVA